VLVDYVFIGGMYYVVPRRMVSVVRAAADWRRWQAQFTATQRRQNIAHKEASSRPVGPNASHLCHPLAPLLFLAQPALC
jgi:hypothetical protein